MALDELYPAPQEGFVATYFLTIRDYEKTRAFYRDILGGEVGLEKPPFGLIKLANIWIIFNEGGGPTDDKPTITLSPPTDPDKASSFLNLRVADIEAK
jgi:catechol 2,3-dioxygenase-like lactoylglutathione lyase family enzyme